MYERGNLMSGEFSTVLGDASNFVLLGESGCGKSEIALNLAHLLSKSGETHLFDLDQTKPLFRIRDVTSKAALDDITIHFSTQYYDTPTLAPGVPERLSDPGIFTVLDVGGNDIGARMIGRFAPLLNQPHSKVFYVVNPFRPWSMNIANIDGIMSAILKVSRLKKIHILANPNIGAETKAVNFVEGLDRAHQLLDPVATLEGICIQETLYDSVKQYSELPILKLHLYLNYDWSE